MTFEEAARAFRSIREAVVQERRASLHDRFNRLKYELRKCALPRRPSGPFSILLAADYGRLFDEYKRQRERCSAAREAIAEFEADANEPTSRLMRWVGGETARRCDGMDDAIMIAIRREERRRRYEIQRDEAVTHLSRESGTEHRLVRPSASRGGVRKDEATLVGQIELLGERYAKTTRDRGWSFDLYPWDEEMGPSISRACWFWYDAQQRFHFAPLIGTKPPLAGGVPPAPANAPLARPADPLARALGGPAPE